MSDEPVEDNYVFLRGRLAGAATTKDLPSGDALTLFRVIVDRPPTERGYVDSVECATTKARVRRSLERANPGDTLEVSGSLRRRFWRGPGGGLASRYTVDVATARVTVRAPKITGRTTGAAPGRTRASV